MQSSPEGRPKTAVPPSVARVLDAVFANPARDWHARELAGLAGMSPTQFRERSRA
jgi:AraC-like DNA-binding protein